MIIRIVRMHFKENRVTEFLNIFHAHKEAIRNFDGCLKLELYRDEGNPLCFTTLSHWANVESLNQYRNSNLFGKVWGQVKNLFSERSHAFSLEKIISL